MNHGCLCMSCVGVNPAVAVCFVYEDLSLGESLAFVYMYGMCFGESVVVCLHVWAVFR